MCVCQCVCVCVCVRLHLRVCKIVFSLFRILLWNWYVWQASKHNNNNDEKTKRKRQRKIGRNLGKIKRRPFELKLFTFIWKIVGKNYVAKCKNSEKGNREEGAGGRRRDYAKMRSESSCRICENPYTIMQWKRQLERGHAHSCAPFCGTSLLVRCHAHQHMAEAIWQIVDNGRTTRSRQAGSEAGSEAGQETRQQHEQQQQLVQQQQQHIQQQQLIQQQQQHVSVYMCMNCKWIDALCWLLSIGIMALPSPQSTVPSAAQSRLYSPTPPSLPFP